jgi:DNA-binding NarL/FixJ family response regulator
MAHATTILIADDHPVFREGLRLIIYRYEEFRIIDEASDGEDALKIIREKNPDVAILDIDMPGMNGLEIARIALQEKLSIKIIVLTMYREEDIFNRAMDYGIYGYVLKESAVTDIIDSIRYAAEGKYYVSPALSGFLLKRSHITRAFTSKYPQLDGLTSTERRILQLIASMKTSKQIADELCVSHRTIENHRMNICNKLDLHGSHALLKFALENKSLIQ